MYGDVMCISNEDRSLARKCRARVYERSEFHWVLADGLKFIDGRTDIRDSKLVLT